MSANTQTLNNFVERLNVFVQAYTGNTGQKPYGILLGPSEYLMLCLWTAEQQGGLGGGGLAPGETEEQRELPLVTSFQEIPVRVKFTDGAEPEIDPRKVPALCAARKEDAPQTKLTLV